MTLLEILDSLPQHISNAFINELDETPIGNTFPIDSQEGVTEIKDAVENAVQQINHLAHELDINERLKVYQLLARLPDAVYSTIV